LAKASKLKKKFAYQVYQLYWGVPGESAGSGDYFYDSGSNSRAEAFAFPFIEIMQIHLKQKIEVLKTKSD
jgi:hypothetical protein